MKDSSQISDETWQVEQNQQNRALWEQTGKIRTPPPLKEGNCYIAKLCAHCHIQIAMQNTLLQ